MGAVFSRVLILLIPDSLLLWVLRLVLRKPALARYKALVLSLWYDRMAVRALRHEKGWDEFSFMNYGMDIQGKNIPAPADLKPGELESWNIYWHTVTSAGTLDLVEKKIVEVGSGRGVGAKYMAELLPVQSVTAIDLSAPAIDLARQRYGHVKNLEYQVGNAQALTNLKTSTYDVLVSVETCHAYPDVKAFYNEAIRVLRPGGHLCITDFRIGDAGVQEFRSDMAALSGAEVEDYHDVSPEVLQSLRNREVIIHELVKRQGLTGAAAQSVMNFMGHPSGVFYQGMDKGGIKYFHCRVRKL